MRHRWLVRASFNLRKHTSILCNHSLQPNYLPNRRKSTMSQERLDAIPDVEIDPDGVFKYILIKVTSKHGGGSKVVVRGDGDCDYHADIFDKTEPGINALGLECRALGGGRIDHKSTNKTILVYGYSMGYGRANHAVTCELLKKKYPDYQSITFSNDGY